VDLELSMWLEDESTSREITGNLVAKWMNAELVSEGRERVFRLNIDLTNLLDELTRTRGDILFHFFDETSGF
jgi:hypothetical protein